MAPTRHSVNRNCEIISSYTYTLTKISGSEIRVLLSARAKDTEKMVQICTKFEVISVQWNNARDVIQIRKMTGRNRLPYVFRD
jgi:hypothetical protein